MKRTILTKAVFMVFAVTLAIGLLSLATFTSGDIKNDVAVHNITIADIPLTDVPLTGIETMGLELAILGLALSALMMAAVLGGRLKIKEYYGS